jgi:hypothetical protein
MLTIATELSNQFQFRPRMRQRRAQDLLNVDLHLAQEGWYDGVAVVLTAQDGHAALEIEQLEDGFRNPVGQAVERADEENALVSLFRGFEALAHREDDLSA